MILYRTRDGCSPAVSVKCVFKNLDAGRGKAAMARIVPSQIVATADKLFTGESKGVGTAPLEHERILHLQGVIDLLRQLPSELLTVSAAEFADLTVAMPAIETTILRYGHGQWPISLGPVSGEDVIHTIRACSANALMSPLRLGRPTYRSYPISRSAKA